MERSKEKDDNYVHDEGMRWWRYGCMREGSG